MVELKLLKEPGFVYDLIYIFYFKFNFNGNSMMDTLPEDQKTKENMEFFDWILTGFGEVPDDLYVFFHMLEHNRCFLSWSYFSPYSKFFTTSYNLDFCIKKLSDTKEVVRRLLGFYFLGISKDEIEKCLESKKFVFSVVKKSKYSYETKCKLYEFFYNPEEYIVLLQRQLQEKAPLLSAYYEKNAQKMLDTFSQMTFESFSKQMNGINNLSFLNSKDEKQVLHISYCLLNKYLLYLFCGKNRTIWLLGYDYASIVDFVKNRKQKPCLDTFGMALNEENRILILQYFLKYKERTIKDLEKAFNFSGATVFHHISVLLEVGILKSRNKERTVLYSLNRQYFDKVIHMLEEYSKMIKNNSIVIKEKKGVLL